MMILSQLVLVVVLVVLLSTTVQDKAKAIKGNRRECFLMALK